MRLPPVIGRYRTKSLLGTGTFATVVLAYDDALATPVALKVLAENWCYDADVRARFVREARMLRRVDHPRLVRVHDIGEHEQRPYFVMDFVPGGTLAERLERRRVEAGSPLDLDAALQLARELAQCIEAAHGVGIVHRDVKPSNLLVRPAPLQRDVDTTALLATGEALVLSDFGLARDITAGSALSIGAGTHGFMAPEQTDPAAAVDERADIFACSAILLLALAGVHASGVADAYRRQKLLAGLDRAVADMLEQGLAADRSCRPSSAREWLDGVESAVATVRGNGMHTSRVPVRRPGLPRWLAALRRDPVFGRDDARAQLEAAWERARAGERNAVVVTGEAGIGKSRLLAEIGAEIAASGGALLAGRCDEGMRLPYAALAHALRPHVDETVLQSFRSQMGGHASTLSMVLPELTTTIGSAVDTGDPESRRALLFDAIECLLAILANGAALALLVDDLQAADAGTLAALHHLVGSDGSGGLLVVATYRGATIDPDDPAFALYQDLHRARVLETTELHGLGETELEQLVAQRSRAQPSQRALRELRRQTGGNPFFVEEILSNLAEEGLDLTDELVRVPRGARDVVRFRTRRLSPAAREVLGAAAVMGDVFDRRVLDVVVPASLEGLDEAYASEFIDRFGDRLTFRHGIVRAALLHDLDQRAQATCHWRIGEALERIHSTELDRYAGEIAHHLHRGVKAGDPAKASTYLERAGEQQFRALALDEAATSLSAALELSLDDPRRDDPRRLRILELLAEIHFWRGDPDAMRESALAGADLARGLASIDALARMIILAARWNRGGALDTRLLDLLDEVEALLPPGDGGMRSQLLSMRAYALQGAARGFDTRSVANEAEAMARRCDDVDALAHALTVRNYTEAGQPTLARTLRVAEELTYVAPRVRRDDHRQQYLTFALRARAQTSIAAGDRTAFDAARAELSDIADRMHSTFLRNQILQWDGAIALAEGRFDVAVDLRDRAFATWHGRPDANRFRMVQSVAAAFDTGEISEVLPQVASMFAGESSSIAYAWRAMHATGLIIRGRMAEGQQQLQELAADNFRGLNDDHERPHALRWLSEGIAIASARGLADALLPIAEPYAGTLLTSPALVTIECAADRAIGQLLNVIGRHDAAIERLQRAAAFEAALGFTALELRTQRWLTQAVHDRKGSGDCNHARKLADDTATRADKLGMKLLASSARELTRAPQA